MTWGILGALDQEVALIREQMQLEETREFYGSQCYIGSIGGQKVNVVCCGVGKVNAAACATSMIRELGAEIVINVGVAGAVGSGLKVLDVVLADQVVYHDQDLDLYERQYPYQRTYHADPALLELSRQVLESQADRSFAYQVGTVATGDEFINDPKTKADIVRRLSPLCVEMEGAAIAQVAFSNGVPFLVIRAMSDNADDEADLSFDELVEPAARHSARIVVDLIQLYGKQ